MSYTIGQFRKEMLGNYLNQTSMTKREIHTSPSGVGGDIYFKDTAFSMTNSFDYQKNYYIKIQIKRTNADQNFSISLANLDNEEKSEQFCGSQFFRQSESCKRIRSESQIIRICVHSGKEKILSKIPK